MWILVFARIDLVSDFVDGLFFVHVEVVLKISVKGVDSIEVVIERVVIFDNESTFLAARVTSI